MIGPGATIAAADPGPPDPPMAALPPASTRLPATLGAFYRIAAAVSVGVPKMADGDIDLYADDLEQDFAQVTRISL